jgi:hypothetical protein
LKRRRRSGLHLNRCHPEQVAWLVLLVLAEPCSPERVDALALALIASKHADRVVAFLAHRETDPCASRCCQLHLVLALWLLRLVCIIALVLKSDDHFTNATRIAPSCAIAEGKVHQEILRTYNSVPVSKSSSSSAFELSRAISSSVLGGSHDAIRRWDFASATDARVNITSASDGSEDFGGISFGNGGAAMLRGCVKRFFGERG